MTHIVYIHFGSSYYQKYSLHQSHHTNPASDIYLVSDNDSIKYPFLKNIDIQRFNTTAKEFAKSYKHLSTNLFDYELFCFQRWFILNEISKEFGFEKLLYLDSDVMLFENVPQDLERYTPFSFTIANGSSPHICYFPDTKVLDEFCTFLMEMYTSPVYMEKMDAKHRHHQEHNEAGGVCDMTAFDYFQQFKGYKALELTEVRNDSVYDNNINMADGFVFDEKNRIKKIEFENKRPFGLTTGTRKRIAFKALHFQGGDAKKFMPLFYQYADLEPEKKQDFAFIKQNKNKAAVRKVKNNIKSVIKKILGRD